MKKNTNQSSLIATARARNGEAVASSWRAFAHTDGTVSVMHYSTHMFDVHADNTVTAVNAGWGSMTDKCGTVKILNGAGIRQNYRSVFG